MCPCALSQVESLLRATEGLESRVRLWLLVLVCVSYTSVRSVPLHVAPFSFAVEDILSTIRSSVSEESMVSASTNMTRHTRNEAFRQTGRFWQSVEAMLPLLSAFSNSMPLCH